MKSIDTLVEDIYSLFANGHESNKSNVDSLGKTIAEVVNDRLASYKTDRKSYLRLSMLGKPDRKVYYELKGFVGETLEPHTKIKFLYGDILEALVLFLSKEAGHTVTGEQEVVTVNSVVGHRDAKIDSVSIDVKSASPYSFKKFKDGSLLFDDPFGYIGQLSGYSEEGIDNGFVAIDKVNGYLTYLPIDKHALIDPSKRIDEINSFMKEATPPERCYGDEPEGKSGNRRLSVGCSYCPYKFICWSDSNKGTGLRTFAYSTGVKYMTHIEKEPRVNENK